MHWLNRTRVHSAHSRWYLVCSRIVRRFSLCFPGVLNDVCISVNCIKANQLIYTTERVFIYDQYLLIQSASQVWRLFETRFPGVKIPSCSSHRLKNYMYKTSPCTLQELKCNIHDEINNMIRGELQRVMGKFYKEVPKMYGQRRWTVPVPPSTKLVCTTVCKIVTEMCVVVSPGSYAVRSPPRVR